MLAGVNDRALTELGKHAQAKADLAEAARLQPSNRVVRTALRGVKRALGAPCACACSTRALVAGVYGTHAPCSLKNSQEAGPAAKKLAMVTGYFFPCYVGEYLNLLL